LFDHLCFLGTQDVPTGHRDFTIRRNSLERCKVQRHSFSTFALLCFCLFVFVLLSFSFSSLSLWLFSLFMCFPLYVFLFLNSGFHFLFSCSQFLMFELARSGNGRAVQEILVNSRHIGVELEEFLNTLLGK